LDAGRAEAGLGAVGDGHRDSLVDRLLRDAAHPPTVRGELSITMDDVKPRWLPLPEGRFQLWFQPESVDYRKRLSGMDLRFIPHIQEPDFWGPVCRSCVASEVRRVVRLASCRDL
jgi:hypothetical protein